jgi:hypothetical protein
VLPTGTIEMIDEDVARIAGSVRGRPRSTLPVGTPPTISSVATSSCRSGKRWFTLSSSVSSAPRFRAEKAHSPPAECQVSFGSLHLLAMFLRTSAITFAPRISDRLVSNH